jgi:hypothetical protein
MNALLHTALAPLRANGARQRISGKRCRGNKRTYNIRTVGCVVLYAVRVVLNKSKLLLISMNSLLHTAIEKNGK